MKPCPICGEPVVGRSDKKYCSNRCGNTARSRAHHAKHSQTDKFREDQKARNKRHKATPHGRYTSHKFRARQSGIPFNLTFEEWFSYWEPYLELTDGVRYCMCRTGDVGPYAVGNVRIDTARNNNLEARGLLHV